jgi:hypothetical protein
MTAQAVEFAENFALRLGQVPELHTRPETFTRHPILAAHWAKFQGGLVWMSFVVFPERVSQGLLGAYTHEQVYGF